MERARKRWWPCSEPHPWTGPWIWWRFARRISCCPGKWLVSIHLWVITYLSADAVRAGNAQSGVTPNIPRHNSSGADLCPFKSTLVFSPALFWSEPITAEPPPKKTPNTHMLGQCSTCRTGSCEQNKKTCVDVQSSRWRKHKNINRKVVILHVCAWIPSLLPGGAAAEAGIFSASVGLLCVDLGVCWLYYNRCMTSSQCDTFEITDQCRNKNSTQGNNRVLVRSQPFFHV